MRVVLVHPAGSNWISGKKDITTAINRMAPIGILSIAAFLERDGHEVSVYDCLGPRAKQSCEEDAKEILKYGAEVVGFSTTTSSFMDATTIAKIVKESDPGVRTICGGVHVSSLGGQLLEMFEQLDYLCPGEGEITLSELAAGKSLDSINGLVWRDGDKIVTNPVREHVRDLDSLPFPAYEKLDGFPKEYTLPIFSYTQSPGASMITSRGCPYQCSYCDRSVFKKGFRSNSPQYIYDHMKQLRERYGIRHINIYDDLFTTNRRRISTLCKMLKEKPLGINFNCAVRVGYTDDELLTMLKEAGCFQVSLGIESADPEMLERHKSGVSLEEVKKTVKKIQEADIRVKGLFMMGLPGETEESIKTTSDFVISLGLDEMNMAKFTPFPGAPVWEGIEKEGTFENDWRQMNCLNFVFIPNGISSKERLDQLYNTHVKRFYTDPVWRRKFKKRAWQNRRSLWHVVKNLPAMLAAKRSFEPKA